MSARGVMAKPVITLKEVERAGSVLAMLKDNRHNGFPVIRQLTDDDREKKTGVFVGVILRNQLLVLLKEKAFTTNVKASYDIDVAQQDTSRLHELVTDETFAQYYPKF